MNSQIISTPCPYWATLFPNEVYVSIFKNFSLTELKTVACVSHLWNGNVNTLIGSPLNEALLSVREIIECPYFEMFNPGFYHGLTREQFYFSSKKASELNEEYFNSNVIPFNQGNGLVNVITEVLKNTECGIPKIHFWKPLPPFTFTIAINILIGRVGEASLKSQVDISFIDPDETQSIGRNCYPSGYFMNLSEVKSDNETPYSISCYFYPGNLNDNSKESIMSNLHDGICAGTAEIEKLYNPHR